MKAYLYDENTKEYITEIEAQIDPLESQKSGKAVYLLPANASFEKPMDDHEGFKRVFDGIKWLLEEIPQTNSDNITTEIPLTNQRIREIRFYLYRNFVDPLMSEYVRKKTFALFKTGEEAELLSQIETKVSEIKEQNPYITQEEANA